MFKQITCLKSIDHL